MTVQGRLDAPDLSTGQIAEEVNGCNPYIWCFQTRNLHLNTAAGRLFDTKVHLTSLLRLGHDQTPVFHLSDLLLPLLTGVCCWRNSLHRLPGLESTPGATCRCTCCSDWSLVTSTCTRMCTQTHHRSTHHFCNKP